MEKEKILIEINGWGDRVGIVLILVSFYILFFVVN